MDNPSRTWTQPGFAVISDAGELPLVHAFRLSQWEAKGEEGRVISSLPEDLRSNLRIVPATLTF